MHVEMDAEQASGVSIEYLRPDDDGHSEIPVHSFGAEDQPQERLPRAR